MPLGKYLVGGLQSGCAANLMKGSKDDIHLRKLQKLDLSIEKTQIYNNLV